MSDYNKRKDDEERMWSFVESIMILIFVIYVVFMMFGN